MRIALLASSFLPRLGGAEVVVHNLAKNLHALGHEVDVITWWGLWRGIRGQLPYRVRPFLPGSFTLNDRTRWHKGHGRRWWVASQICAYQTLFRYDVWNVHMAFPLSLFAVPALNKMGVPVVTTCHGEDIFVSANEKYGVRLNPFIDDALRGALNNSDGVTAISTAVREELRRIGVPDEKMTLIYNGVDVERMQQLNVDRVKIRQELGLPPDVPLIITVGRNHPIKGFSYIPGIASRLRAAGLDFRWVVVGDETDKLATILAREGVSDMVKLLPGHSPGKTNHGYEMPPDRLIEIYRASDIFVSASLSEAFPLTWIEAMAAGLPLVAGDVMRRNDILQDGLNGHLVPRGDWNGIADALEELLTSKAEMQRMGIMAKVDAEEFSWSILTNRYLLAYQKAIDSRTKIHA